MKIRILRNNEKVNFARELIYELDDLYDDLSYDKEEKEIEYIKSKIKIREELLKQLGGC